MIITRKYVTFEVAKLLKDKGFDVPTNSGYSNDRENGRPIVYAGATDLDWNFGIHQRGQNRISRPEHWMVIEWLRLQHGIHLKLDSWMQEDNTIEGYDCCVFRTWKDKTNYELKLLDSSVQPLLYDTPHAAIDAAFIDCLELI